MGQLWGSLVDILYYDLSFKWRNLEITIFSIFLELILNI